LDCYAFAFSVFYEVLRLASNKTKLRFMWDKYQFVIKSVTVEPKLHVILFCNRYRQSNVFRLTHESSLEGRVSSAIFLSACFVLSHIAHYAPTC